MTKTKPYHIYIALTRAVDPSVDNQISKHLKLNSDKHISITILQRILQELGSEARDMYFNVRKREFYTLADDAIIEVDVADVKLEGMR